jgi:hypothetical protein
LIQKAAAARRILSLHIVGKQTFVSSSLLVPMRIHYSVVCLVLAITIFTTSVNVSGIRISKKVATSSKTSSSASSSAAAASGRGSGSSGPGGAQTLEPTLHSMGAFDRLIATDKWQHRSDAVNYFDSRVFNAKYYMDKHPELKQLGVKTTAQARANWLRSGIENGKQGCATFSPFVYLQQNKDVSDRYGVKNYRMAIVHYLTVGVNETYRATGGPERLPIYDTRVFDWKWYVDHNKLRVNGVDTEAKAKRHWKLFGLMQGLQASANINLHTYLDKNPDLFARYGKHNTRAALSYFLNKGIHETWRENGGSSCKFWATWCQQHHNMTDVLIHSLPEFPVYNSSGTSLENVPSPMRAGRTVEINGRQCSDLSTIVPPRKEQTRIQVVRHAMMGKTSTSNKCNVFVRHMFDVRTSVQGVAFKDISLSHWSFSHDAPREIIQPPMSEAPPKYEYAGHLWSQPPSGPGSKVIAGEYTVTMHGIRPTDRRYTIEEFVMQSPLSPELNKTKTLVMRPERIYNIVHVYRLKANSSFSGNGIGGIADDDLANNGTKILRGILPPKSNVTLDKNNNATVSAGTNMSSVDENVNKTIPDKATVSLNGSVTVNVTAPANANATKNATAPGANGKNATNASLSSNATQSSSTFNLTLVSQNDTKPENASKPENATVPVAVQKQPPSNYATNTSESASNNATNSTGSTPPPAKVDATPKPDNTTLESNSTLTKMNAKSTKCQGLMIQYTSFMSTCYQLGGQCCSAAVDSDGKKVDAAGSAIDCGFCYQFMP